MCKVALGSSGLLPLQFLPTPSVLELTCTIKIPRSGLAAMLKLILPVLTVCLLYTLAVMDLWICVAGCQADSDKPAGPTSLFILMRREQQKLLWCSSTSETAA